MNQVFNDSLLCELNDFFSLAEKTQLSSNEIEGFFKKLDEFDLPFDEFICTLCQTRFWSGLEDGDFNFKELCIALSHAVTQYNLSLEVKPCFHGANHFRDVTFSLSLLASQHHRIRQSLKSPLWQISDESYWLLLFCAIGHDFGHTGLINSFPHQLEINSVKLIGEFLQTRCLSNKQLTYLQDRVEYLVLSTDPRDFKKLSSLIKNDTIFQTELDYLSFLLIESDLLASTLPRRGMLLGEKLRQEWSTNYPVEAKKVSTPEGRYQFLAHIEFLSPHAECLGIMTIHQKELNNFRLI